MKKNTFNLIVPSNFSGYRIDKFLQLKITDLSRTRIQSLIQENQVNLNDKIVKTSSKKIKENDKIMINFPKPKETSIKPDNIPLNILYDDEDIIVINKSPGVVVHPGAGNHEKTIVAKGVGPGPFLVDF